MIEYVLILLLIAIFLLIYALNTTGRQEKLEKIDRLGGTNYIKQQLKTESADKIAEKHNLTLVSLDKYCQEHDTTINKLLKEIYRDNAKERERQEAYEILDRLGGTEHIKNRLKTTNPEQIVRVYNITTENLNEYCQNHGTSINQLKKEIQEQEKQHRKRLERKKQEEQERKKQEAYEKIDQLGGTQYIKQQLKAKSDFKIAQEHNITRRNLNEYCQKHGTSITQLQNDIEQERQIQEAYELFNQSNEKFIYQLIEQNQSREYIYEDPYKTKEILTEDDMKAIKDFNYRRMKDEQIKNRYNN